MQANEFEKEIRNKMQGLEMTAGAEVWQQVAARINQRKKRRKLLIFWLAACLLVLTLGGWWTMTQPIEEKIAVKGESQSERNKAGNDTTVDMNYRKRMAGNGDQLNKEMVKTLPKTNHKKPINSLLEKHLAAASVQQRTTATNATPNVVKPATPASTGQSAATLLTATTHRTLNHTQQPLPMHKFYHPEIDSLVPVVAKEAPAKDTISVAGKTNSIRLPVSNWNAGFTLYAGAADNISSLLPGSEKSYSRDALSSQNPPGNYNLPALPPLTYKPGLSFGAGVSLTRKVYQKLSLSAGIDYHFLSSRSKTGTKVISPASLLYDSLLSLSTSYNYYYRQGGNVAYTNKYHLLQLPVTLQYQLNQSRQKPVSLFAGIVPGYMFSSQALYANRGEGIYYVEKRQLNRFQLSGSAGLLFTLLHPKPFTIAAGPALQYSFTNLTKTILSNNQHLFFAGVKANFTLP